jgi:hypothetical protein
LFHDALERFRKVEASAELIRALNNLADIAINRGDDNVARRCYAEALQTAKRTHIVPFALDTLARLAHIQRDDDPRNLINPGCSPSISPN